ncbi:stalk domain-containing protein [Paenibacillus spongiae]|uniref:Glycosyl hydrolase family 18 protein n=1 Tax=Paenibacillus spongiae TaxID=2909671 RepID=A0ABY5S262_9BACL|nr:stalk domain-containing protein [Paenibacillus spongiae]UVI27971.1 glycosyl hydrolase family 18 protein [Paenibacillus spongiae]
MTIFRKGAIACSALLLLLGSVPANATSASPAKTTIMLDDYPLSFPIEPTVINGTTMVPFRVISEALRINVVWNGAAKTITATKAVGGQSKQVTLRLNDKKAFVGGQSALLNVAPISKGGYTLVPLNFFSSQFGAQVSWDGKTHTVDIRSPREDMYTVGFYATSSFKEIRYVPAFDSVAFGWTRIDDEGRITLQGESFFWPKPAGEITPEKIVDDVTADGSSPFLMVFGTDGKGQLTKMLTDEALRTQAIDTVMKLAADNGFQGITLDFEGLGWSGDIDLAKKTTTEFVRMLSEQAKPAGLKLSLAVHPLNGAYHGYDYKALAKYADELIVMAYPYEGEKGPEPMDRVDQAIRMALKEVPKEKLVLGISFGSEKAESVNAKIGLAKRYSLKGIAIWRIGIIGEAAMKQMERTITMNS